METNASAPRKLHVLIVDDSTQLVWFFQEILKRDGYESTVLADGARWRGGSSPSRLWRTARTVDAPVRRKPGAVETFLAEINHGLRCPIRRFEK